MVKSFFTGDVAKVKPFASGDVVKLRQGGDTIVVTSKKLAAKIADSYSHLVAYSRRKVSSPPPVEAEDVDLHNKYNGCDEPTA